MPPQMPGRRSTFNASARQSSRTGHRRQCCFARASASSSPGSGSNMAGSRFRHAPRPKLFIARRFDSVDGAATCAASRPVAQTVRIDTPGQRDKPHTGGASRRGDAGRHDTHMRRSPQVRHCAAIAAETDALGTMARRSASPAPSGRLFDRFEQGSCFVTAGPQNTGRLHHRAGRRLSVCFGPRRRRG